MAEIVSPDTPVSKLDCKVAFENLSNNEKLYAHYLSRASFEGGLIVLLQTSPESVPIFLLLQSMFSGQSVQELKNTCQCSEEEWKALEVYAAAFYCNMGNYKGFGDTKFIPGLAKERLYGVLQASSSYKTDQERLDNLWQSCADQMYSITEREKQLGMKNMGITTYYSANCTTEDAEFVQDFMTEKNVTAYNTRAFKQSGTNGDGYELRLASVATGADPVGDDDDIACLIGNHNFRGKTIDITRGDYSDLMKRLVDNLQSAKLMGWGPKGTTLKAWLVQGCCPIPKGILEHASNETEKSMLDGYIKSFTTGSINAHKDGSRYWIKDKGPIVETYIGFIETYRDPFGVRGEFEGFVAMVNKEMSKKFTNLVSAAEQLLPLLPWPLGFEKDKFLQPDFTSLDVLSFASSGIPVGINIPNYDEIRQDEGFKNVSLGNVLAAGSQDKRVSFLGEKDQELYCKLKVSAFEVQVGLHELLGHGSGKLFVEDETGQLNFDNSEVTIPETGQKVDSWYHHGETYDSKFSAMGSSYEECRAECVGLHLCLSPDVLSIFGYHGDAADDIIYINWLNMVRAGLLGLEYYTPEANKWRQAHMQARYVILQVLLEEDGLVKITEITASDGQPDLLLQLDRQKIATIGKTAIANFLQKLQVYKSTCDVEAATALYNKFSSVSDGFLKMRDIVLARKIPRRLYVQPHTVLSEDGSVCLVEFDAGAGGVIESSIARWPSYDEQLEKAWLKDKHHWPYPPSP